MVLSFFTDAYALVFLLIRVWHGIFFAPKLAWPNDSMLNGSNTPYNLPTTAVNGCLGIRSNSINNYLQIVTGFAFLQTKEHITIALLF